MLQRAKRWNYRLIQYIFKNKILLNLIRPILKASNDLQKRSNKESDYKLNLICRNYKTTQYLHR